MLRTTFGLLLSLALSATAFGHCQVPCGIFTDQLRFEQLLEDEQTIAKAQAQINELAGKATAQDMNQLTRWVITKEEHAAKVQETIATYFLAQRIKADSPRYMEQLKAAHAVTVAAMKCKQSTDAATAKTLEDAIFNLYRAYEGKEPAFKHSH
jgi:nickel superoxide dismutase